jgi:NAD-dependent dihydropyrimidine dehydrogenase PreA subunit
MSEELYTRLREYMNNLPGGYPATDTGVEIRILKKLFTQEDAELILQLKQEAEEVSAIAGRIGLDESLAGKRLEDMAKRGLIFRIREQGKVTYRPISFLVGIYEFQLNRLDREFVEMWEEYVPYIGMTLAPLENKQLRVAPVDSAVQDLPSVETYNRVRDLVKEQELIAMMPCICRRKEGILDNPCDRPEDLCFSFGQFAQYVMENEMGKRISTDEAMKFLALAEESSLVLSASNTQELAFLCCCCGCCCGSLKRLKMLANPADFCQSYYQAKIDPESCTACGDCLDRCQVDAIKEEEDFMEVAPGRCIGCGLCVSTCPAEAIELVAKQDPKTPPKDFGELLGRLARERGVA